MQVVPLILMAALSVGAPQTSPQVPKQERDVLMDLFAATGGERWERRDKWGTSEPVCDWYGVWCDFLEADANRPVVAGLALSVNNLRGVLPASLSQLENLKSLHVSGNHLSGDVPERLLERWDKHELDFAGAGNAFRNFIARATVDYSASGTLCAVHDDLRFRLEVDEVRNRARFESVRCADAQSRKTYCLVREGTPSSLGRLSRALRAIGFTQSRASYEYQFVSVTHDVFLTTNAEWGDGSKLSLETYGRQGPREAWMAQQLFLGLSNEASWVREFRKAKCGFE